MLGRKTYTQEELDQARTAVDEQLATYQALVAAAGEDPDGAREAFDASFFNMLVLALDRYFVHRLRGVTGKAGTPLNELEMLSQSLMNGGGVLREISVIAYAPENSVTKLSPGDTIRLDEETFAALAAGVFAEVDEKYVNA